MAIMKNRYFGFRGGWLTFWVTVACTTSMTLFGYDQAVFGGVIVTPDFLSTMNQPDANLVGTITSIYDVWVFLPFISAFSLHALIMRSSCLQ